MTYPIQQLVLPGLSFGAPCSMYARVQNEQCLPLLSKRTLKFSESGTVTFDTYFNALTVHTWKRHCTIENLFLNLSGKGRFILRFGLHRMGHSSRWISEQSIELNSGDEFKTKLNFWNDLDAGLLYFSLTALSDGKLDSGYFSTSTQPTNSAKLGIVITHFNRKQYVLPAIKRIQQELFADSRYAGKIDLIIVDNSRNITEEEAPGAIVIPNKNLGGSGGFMRGLLHLKDNGYTHCLFMDDDASCEIESIRRAFALFQFSLTPKIALAGSLLREVEPFRLFEKGAKFDGFCRPINSGLDMCKTEDLVLAEINDKAPDYGAWWFYMFKLTDIKHYSFPFFVRGDDIMFGLTNNFSIVTMNGIACWGDDFGLKSSPLTFYLDIRNHLLQSLIDLNKSRFSCIWLVMGFSFGRLFSYNYASSKAINIAIEHVLEGPKFWRRNLDLSDVRKKVNSLTPSENLQPVIRSEYDIEYSDHRPERLRTLVRWLSLNGFLLPSFLFKNKILYQHKYFRGVFREIYRYKRVLYEYEPYGVGYVATHSKKEFFSTLFSLLKVLTKLLLRFSSIRAEYTKALPSMMSENFWRQVYSKENPSNNDTYTQEKKTK